MWAAEDDEQKTVFPKRIGFRSLLGNATGNSQTLILEINTCRIRISREKIHPSFSRHARDAKPKYLNLNNKGGSPAAPSAEAEFILVPLGALLEIRKMRIRVTHFCGSRKKEGG